MINADRLSRRYGDLVAVDGVSFAIEHGEIVGLLGHNGAGKTTIMKMLTGYLEPTAGSVGIDGVDIALEPHRAQARIGYLPENLPLYPEMSVVDYLDFAAELRGVSRDGRPTAVRGAIEATELGEKAMDAIATLSRGYRQRLGVAQAILHRPRFLILDEPTNGLDPSQTQHMRALIKSLAAEATVILSTHIMQEVEAVCDRVMILRSGRLAVDESLAALKQGQRLILTTDASIAAVAAAVDAVADVAAPVAAGTAETGAQHLAMAVAGELAGATAAVARALVAAEIPVFGLAPEYRDLESLFREVSDSTEELEHAA